ncbi:MAG TPA: DUF6046 domain-containing protein, partial [Crocinitomicaceae bacterium]|nr:DUF6046 domain-containing protein [Crocinitomicaceae bacterium]
MEFKIQDLAVMASDIHYNPALAVAVNKALNFRGSQVEYNALMKEATQIAIGYENIALAEMKDYGKGSVFGLPLWQPLTFLGKPGQVDLLLENAVLELNRTKNIVTTVVQGRDTSVDEFINNGDWQISVSGILATKKPEYPM